MVGRVMRLRRVVRVRRRVRWRRRNGRRRRGRQAGVCVPVRGGWQVLHGDLRPPHRRHFELERDTPF